MSVFFEFCGDGVLRMTYWDLGEVGFDDASGGWALLSLCSSENSSDRSNGLGRVVGGRIFKV